MTDNSVNDPKLLDFNFVGDEHFSFEDMLHHAYLEGKKDFQKELISKMQNGLQTSAMTSSLFKEKLKEQNIEVKDMFLRILDLTEFECLVLISDKAYYSKEMRWSAYNIARNLNNRIDEIDLKFSLMPYSEYIKKDTITSEGYCFKYGAQE